MTAVILAIYASGWVLTTLAALGVAHRAGRRSVSAPGTAAVLALVAGLLWPVLVLAAAQLGVVAALVAWIRARSDPSPAPLEAGDGDRELALCS
jgi:hypothetical protein